MSLQPEHAVRHGGERGIAEWRNLTRHAPRRALGAIACLLLVALVPAGARGANFAAVVFVAELRPAGVSAERVEEATAALRTALAQVPGVVVADPAVLEPVLPALGLSTEVCGSAACAEYLARAADAEWVVTGLVRPAAGEALQVELSVVSLGKGGEAGRAEASGKLEPTDSGRRYRVAEVAARVAAVIREGC